jgi:predicted RNase H-like HicB family nuclease
MDTQTPPAEVNDILKIFNKKLKVTSKHIYLYCKNEVWYAECPEIPGCEGQGITEKDAKDQVLNLASYWFSCWITSNKEPKWQKPRDPEWYEKTIPINFGK